DSSRLYCSRGNTYLALNQIDSALNDLNQAIELDPQYPSAYFCRSEVFNRIGDKEQEDADKEIAAKLQLQISQAVLETQGIMFQNW
ncbi:uncharacterized protein METZ01_LOCUS443833, partial [marine metagenome]